MSLKNCLTDRPPITCESETSVSNIAKLLSKNNIGAVVVTKNEKPIGVITDRDIVLRCVSLGRNPAELHAKDIMSEPVHTICSSCSIRDVAMGMREFECRRMVVTEPETGRLLGVISSGDLMELLVYELNLLAWVATPHEAKLIEKRVA